MNNAETTAWGEVLTAVLALQLEKASFIGQPEPQFLNHRSNRLLRGKE